MLEGLKGGLVLGLGFGIVVLIHGDLAGTAERLVEHLHLDPASHYCQVFLGAVDAMTDLQLWWLAVAAFVYATVRFLEAYGLWRQQRWAEWFALVTGAIYIPFELYELCRGVTWTKLTVLIINMLVVGYIAFALWQVKRNRSPPVRAGS
jgi:uncharacterized membrane protein (DUF2068 family)